MFDNWAIGAGTTPCYPDCNGDEALDLADLTCFQTRFALGDPYAACNGPGAEPVGLRVLPDEVCPPLPVGIIAAVKPAARRAWAFLPGHPFFRAPRKAGGLSGHPTVKRASQASHRSRRGVLSRRVTPRP